MDNEMVTAITAAIEEKFTPQFASIHSELTEMKNDIRAIKIDIENHVKPDIQKLSEGYGQVSGKVDKVYQTVEKTALDVQDINNVQGLLVHKLRQAGLVNLVNPIEP